jgi:hypothetical protein
MHLAYIGGQTKQFEVDTRESAGEDSSCMEHMTAVCRFKISFNEDLSHLKQSMEKEKKGRRQPVKLKLSLRYCSWKHLTESGHIDAAEEVSGSTSGFSPFVENFLITCKNLTLD